MVGLGQLSPMESGSCRLSQDLLLGRQSGNPGGLPFVHIAPPLGETLPKRRLPGYYYPNSRPRGANTTHSPAGLTEVSGRQGAQQTGEGACGQGWVSPNQRTSRSLHPNWGSFSRPGRRPLPRMPHLGLGHGEKGRAAVNLRPECGGQWDPGTETPAFSGPLYLGFIDSR